MLDLEIAPRDVAAHLKSGETGLILLDVREPWEFADGPDSRLKAHADGRNPFPRL